jgi:phosphoglycolate phosphatase
MTLTPAAETGPGRARPSAYVRHVLVVGFDLDMTLIDSRPGIVATTRALSRETGTYIDAELVVERLGPKLEDELAEWFPTDEVLPAADRYRELYADLGVPGTTLLPGAADAVAAVTEAGGRTLVVTAKFEPNARLCLTHVGLQVDAVFGWLHGEEKGATLAEEGATIYVGDTPPDMHGAKLAEAVAIGVTTGPHSADELRDAGADVVLESLDEFAGWFGLWLGGKRLRRPDEPHRGEQLPHQA